MNKILFLLVLLLGACSREFVSDDMTQYEMVEVQVTLQTDDQNTPGGTDADPAEGTRATALDASDNPGPVSIRFGTGCWDDPVVSDPTSADSPAVRAVDPGTVDLTSIHDVWTMQYNASGLLIGKPVYRSGLTAGASIKLMVAKSGTEEHTLWLVANTGSSSLFTKDNIPTLERLHALAKAYTDETSVIDGGVLMSGSWKGVIVDGATLPTVKMTRAVAKLTFTYSTDRFRDGVLKVLNVQLKSIPLHASYLPQADASVTAYPAGASGSHTDYAVDLAPGESAGSYTWIVPENVRGANPSILDETEKTGANAPAGQAAYATFIEVRGKVTWAGGTQQNVLYTLFAGADFADYSLRRNGAYTMEVAFIGASDDDGRVQKDDASPFLSTQVAFAEITGAQSIATGVVTSDGGSPLTEVGFYLSPTAGFDPAGAGVTKVVGTLDAAAASGTGTSASHTLPTSGMSGLAPTTGAYAVPTTGVPYAVAAPSSAAMPGLRATTYAAAGTPFSANLTELQAMTTYYVRPYAVNAYGTTIGVESSFSTNGLPTVVTSNVTIITNNSANTICTVKDWGTGYDYYSSRSGCVVSTVWNFDPAGADVTEYLTYSQSDNRVTMGPLDYATTYYFRAFARTTVGTAYGEQKSFTTTDWPGFYRTRVYWLKGSRIGVAYNLNWTDVDMPTAITGIEIGPIGFTPGTGVDVPAAYVAPQSVPYTNHSVSAVCPEDEWEIRFYAQRTADSPRQYSGVVDKYFYRSTMLPQSSYQQAYAIFLKNINSELWSQYVLGVAGEFTPPIETAGEGENWGRNRLTWYNGKTAEQDPCDLFYDNANLGYIRNELGSDEMYHEPTKTLYSRAVVDRIHYEPEPYTHMSVGFFGTISPIQISISTLPTTSVPTVSAITATSATISVSSTSAGSAPGSTVVDRGIHLALVRLPLKDAWAQYSQWAKDPVPSHRPAVTTGTDPYMVTVTGLTPNTTYYVRTVTKNSEGSRFVSDAALSFTTASL